jgi:hypothetical protein
MTCEKLTPIVPGPQKWGSRERPWYPITHDDPNGRPCLLGPKREIK